VLVFSSQCTAETSPLGEQTSWPLCCLEPWVIEWPVLLLPYPRQTAVITSFFSTIGLSYSFCYHEIICFLSSNHLLLPSTLIQLNDSLCLSSLSILGKWAWLENGCPCIPVTGAQCLCLSQTPLESGCCDFWKYFNERGNR